MNEEIKPGDLVMVVRGAHCCGHMGDATYGAIFTVGRIFPLRKAGSYSCRGCGVEAPSDMLVAEVGPRAGLPVSMLKKLPPPAEKEAFRIKTPAEILADFELGVAVYGTF